MKPILFFSFFLLVQTVRSQDNEAKKYSFILENGFSYNYSSLSGTGNFAGLDPKFNPFKGYCFSAGIEMNRKDFLYTFKINKVNLGNQLEFTRYDSLNRPLSLHLGIWRPCYMVNFSAGRKFAIRNLEIKWKVGFDFFAFYGLNSNYDVLFWFDDAKKDTLPVNVLSNSLNAIHLTPNSTLSVSYPVTIKKKSRFLIGYNFTFNYGVKDIYETAYYLSYNTKNFEIRNRNRGTYLTHSLLIQYPLNRKKPLTKS